MSFNYNNCTTQTLDRIQVEERDNNSQKIDHYDTPSLEITKTAKLKFPPSTPPIYLVPEMYTVSKEEATCEVILEKLKKYGLCKIKKLYTDKEIEDINESLDPFFEAKRDDPRLFPKETIRVTNTVSKSPVVVNKIMSHPLNLEVTHHVLDQANAFWIGDNLNIGVCPAIVSTSIAFQVGPNSAVQAWHRDDHSDHNIRKAQNVEDFNFKSETQLGFSVALTRTTKKNGATRIIPGSHLWDQLQRPIDDDSVIYNEMEQGDVTFLLSSVFHSASSNATENEFRRILILFMCRGNCRANENIYFNADVDYYKQFSVDQLKRLGFAMSEPYANMIELQDPLTIFKHGYKRHSNYTDVCEVVPL